MTHLLWPRLNYVAKHWYGAAGYTARSATCSRQQRATGQTEQPASGNQVFIDLERRADQGIIQNRAAQLKHLGTHEYYLAGNLLPTRGRGEEGQAVTIVHKCIEARPTTGPFEKREVTLPVHCRVKRPTFKAVLLSLG